MSVTEAGAVTEWPQTLVWALFNTPEGASNALAQLQAQGAGQSPLIYVENTAVIEKDASGNYTFNEREDLSGWKGLANGLMIGGLMGIMTPGTSLFSMAGKTGAWLGLGGRIHDAGFEDNDLRTAAEAMPPNSSALLTVVSHHWTDDLVRYLNTVAYKVGWTEVTETVGKMLEGQAAAAKGGAD